MRIGYISLVVKTFRGEGVTKMNSSIRNPNIFKLFRYSYYSDIPTIQIFVLFGYSYHSDIFTIRISVQFEYP